MERIAEFQRCETLQFDALGKVSFSTIYGPGRQATDAIRSLQAGERTLARGAMNEKLSRLV